MKKIYAFILMLTLSVFAFGDIFNEKDSVNVTVGIETQKFPSGVVDVNYQFEPDENLFVQIGNQTRLMNGWDDYNTTYVGLLLDVDNFIWDKNYVQPLGGSPGNSERVLIKDKEHKFYVLTRVGLSANLDKNDAGLYAGAGLQYGKEKFIRVMFEAENGKFRNTIGAGMKFDSLKFYS